MSYLMIEQTMDLAKAKAALKASAIGHTIDYYPTVESTMFLGHKASKDQQIPSGLVILTDLQTQGRGRLNRTWQTPPGKALLLSIVLGPDHLPQPMTLLPMMIAVSVRRGIVAIAPELADRIRFKWPNDILGMPAGIHSASDGNHHSLLKIAGILIEASFGATEEHYAVVGVGLNVNQTIDELPTVAPNSASATSLKILGGQPFDRTQLLIALCRELSTIVLQARPRDASLRADAMPSTAKDALHHCSVPPYWHEWRTHLQTIGQEVTVTSVRPEASQQSEPPVEPARPAQSDEQNEHPRSVEARGNTFSGIAVDVTTDGYLIVENAQGQRRTFASGDVTLRSSPNE